MPKVLTNKLWAVYYRKIGTEIWTMAGNGGKCCIYSHEYQAKYKARMMTGPYFRLPHHEKSIIETCVERLFATLKPEENRKKDRRKEPQNA